MTIEQDFEAFFQAFPKRTGKIAAFKQYQCAVYYQNATHDEIMSGVEAYKKHLVLKETPFEYIAAPQRWLDAGRWADEYEANLPKPDRRMSVQVGETMSQAQARWERQGLKLVVG